MKLSFFIFASFVLAGVAQATGMPDVAQLKKACREDVEKFCPGIPAGPDVLKCLLQQEQELAPLCRQEITAVKTRLPISEKKEAAFLPLRPTSFLPPQITSLSYTGWIEPRADTPHANQQKLSLQVPVYLDEEKSIAVGGGASSMQIDGLLLDNFEVFGQYQKKLNGDKTIGGRLSIGSASDHVFSGMGVTTLTGSVDYSFPQSENSRWILLVFFSNNNPIGNYIPIPGATYVYYTKTFSGTFGFPFTTVRWMPFENWSLYGALFGPNVISEIAYGNPFIAQVFTGFNWGAQSFIERDRVQDLDRLYYIEKRLLLGGRVSLTRGLSAELSSGYAFGRSLSVQQKYLFFVKGSATPLENAWFSQLNLRYSF